MLVTSTTIIRRIGGLNFAHPWEGLLNWPQNPIFSEANVDGAQVAKSYGMNTTGAMLNNFTGFFLPEIRVPTLEFHLRSITGFDRRAEFLTHTHDANTQLLAIFTSDRQSVSAGYHDRPYSILPA
jgi:hypothetical protein